MNSQDNNYEALPATAQGRRNGDMSEHSMALEAAPLVPLESGVTGSVLDTPFATEVQEGDGGSETENRSMGSRHSEDDLSEDGSLFVPSENASETTKLENDSVNGSISESDDV